MELLNLAWQWVWLVLVLPPLLGLPYFYFKYTVPEQLAERKLIQDRLAELTLRQRGEWDDDAN